MAAGRRSVPARSSASQFARRAPPPYGDDIETGADAAALGVGAPLILSSLNIKDLHLQPAPSHLKNGVSARRPYRIF